MGKLAGSDSWCELKSFRLTLWQQSTDGCGQYPVFPSTMLAAMVELEIPRVVFVNKIFCLFWMIYDFYRALDTI